jgi:hypothetical protein
MNDFLKSLNDIYANPNDPHIKEAEEKLKDAEEKTKAEIDREKYLDIQLKFEKGMLELEEKQNDMRINCANKVLDFMNTARRHVLEENDLVQKAQKDFSSIATQLKDNQNFVDDLIAIQKG